MEISYRTDLKPAPQQVIDLYDSAGLSRPTGDPSRIARMIEHANLVVTAWDGDLLVGVSRAVTDWSWCCYLSDLAVRKEYGKQGIGKKLVDLTKETAGPSSMLLLLSVPDAMAYYPKIGLVKQDNAFLISREK